MTCRVRPRSQASNPHDLVALFNWLSAVFAAPPDRDSSPRIVAGRPRLGWTTSLRCPAAPRRSRACAGRSTPTPTTRSSPRGSARPTACCSKALADRRRSRPTSRFMPTADACSARRPPRWRRFSPPTTCRWPLPLTRPPDHIAVELAAAARLLAEGEPDAEAIIARLQGWIPAFAADCAAADANGFWAGAAAVLIAIVGLATRQPANAEIPDATKH